MKEWDILHGEGGLQLVEMRFRDRGLGESGIVQRGREVWGGIPVLRRDLHMLDRLSLTVVELWGEGLLVRC